MTEMNSLGKALILFGVIAIVLGCIVLLGGKLSWFGRLPGDVYVQKKNFSFYFPITTSIILSILISIVMILFRKR